MLKWDRQEAARLRATHLLIGHEIGIELGQE